MARTDWIALATTTPPVLRELVVRAAAQSASGEALKEKIYRDAVVAPIKTMEQELVL